jgi:hypothetical protein
MASADSANYVVNCGCHGVQMACERRHQESALQIQNSMSSHSSTLILSHTARHDRDTCWPEYHKTVVHSATAEHSSTH